MRYAIALCLSLALLAGCVSTHDRMLRAGFPEPYAAGYSDGESSGFVAGGHPYYQFRKNAWRFDADGQYRQGWTDGFNVAKGQYDALDRGWGK